MARKRAGGVLVAATASVAPAQEVGELFRKINPSVVVVRAKGREVHHGAGGRGLQRDGLRRAHLADGKVVTAAHVVRTMDDITVECLGGESTATIGGQEIVVRGDIILEMAGVRLDSDGLSTVLEKLGAMKSGQTFKTSVLRAGKIVELGGKVP